MSRFYLKVPFREKDEAKALGARFDWDAKLWYVEANAELVLFKRWLPADTLVPETTTGASASQPLVAASANEAGGVAQAGPVGITLSQLLNGVAAAIRQACGEGVWTIVEIVEAQARGHIYLEVSERDEDGRPIARARAMIWQSTADRILPAFEKATGVTLGAGIQLLVLAKPTFHVQYGFSLQIEAIDAQYTLGYLEARRREIRARLKREGVFDNNRQLPPPWDFNQVLVVAPHEAAGLGDFRQEAQRLEQHGICRFTYVHSRFQGEGAAREIANAIEQGLSLFATDAPPDAVVIIRGGGATGDLAWLDDYDLARTICDLKTPVFTGIGHQRDSTIPDEVAHTAFDTPSKVILGIEQRIRQRTAEAVEYLQIVFGHTDRLLLQNQKAIDTLHEQVRHCAREQLSQAREGSRQAHATVGRLAVQKVHHARTTSRDWLVVTREQARIHINDAARNVPRLLIDVRSRTQARIARANQRLGLDLQAVLSGARLNHKQAATAATASLHQLIDLVIASIKTAMRDSQALMREIIGQGPDKTLARGFAVVRSDAGQLVSTSQQAAKQPSLEIQFKDGRVPVKPL